ncbi:MAG: ferritin-like domain-containing protein [Steroidobacteraceae bacterium]
MSPTFSAASAPSADSSGAQESFPGGPIRFGSDEHKSLFCHTLLDTFDPYKPKVIDWPKLDAETRDRLVSLPIWDIAVQTEGRAGLHVATYAATAADPLLRKAMDLNAFEEGRHKHVLANLVTAYGIALAPEPQYLVPRDPEWAFMVTGYSECIDSFFAFGLFESAKRSGFFPEALVDTFEPVIREEARHILFFVNWAAWHRRTMPFWRRPFFELKVLAVWLFLIWERIGIARDMGNGVQDNNFTMTGAQSLGSDINLAELIDLCLAENSRRMSPYDRRLLRPFAVPALARLARRFMRPKRAARTA